VCTVRNLINDQLGAQPEFSATSMRIWGQAGICALLLSSGMDELQTLQIVLKCQGPIGDVCVISDGNSTLKGYVGNYELDGADYDASDSVSMIGGGTVQVVKSHPEWKKLYNGITRIDASVVDADISGYLRDSEQRVCFMAADVALKAPINLCVGAGGYLVERLPGCSDKTLLKVQENLNKLGQQQEATAAIAKAPVNLLATGMTPYDITQQILDGLDMKPLKQVVPTLTCECSEAKFMAAINLLPTLEIADILDKGEALSTSCQFCGNKYNLACADIKEVTFEKMNASSAERMKRKTAAAKETAEEKKKEEEEVKENEGAKENEGSKE
jgi:molecular chaperone Hsp33